MCIFATYSMLVRFIFLLLAACSLVSCREYKKLLKSADLDKKYSEAVRFYEKGDCVRSLQLFDELLTVYKGTPKYESIYFYYAYSHYCVGDHLLAAYHFRIFTKSYPTSKHAEECAFMAALCYYQESPRYTLDQTETRNAIRELQTFINRYPNSTRMDTCNLLIDKLRVKLEKKDMEIALQYYHMEDYKAAMTSFNNLLREYPDTRYRELVNYYIIKAGYEQAIRSVDEKKIVRLTEVVDQVNKFQVAFRDSGEYRTEVNLIGIGAKNLKEKAAWEIPFLNFENRKYAKAIEGFKEFLTLYPESPKADKAKEYISDSYFLLVQLSYQNIEKSYGVNPVINAYREYQKNAGKYTPLINERYSSSLAAFKQDAAWLAIDRVISQLEDVFRMKDVNSLTLCRITEDFFKEAEGAVADPGRKAELNARMEKIRTAKAGVEKEIGFWFYDSRNYQACRGNLQKFFPSTEKNDHQSKSFYYFMLSLWNTADEISLVRPDFRKVYYDSLYRLDKMFSPRLSPKYARKMKALMEEVREDELRLPGEYIYQLYKIGQYDKVVEQTDLLKSTVTRKEVLSRMLYYRIRVDYTRARFGFASDKTLKIVQDGLAGSRQLHASMHGKYRWKAGRLIRLMKKRERTVRKSLVK
ncbi:MAG: outer membrane protein assembly factor BamD [Bacteroidia bacterium]|nr:outer membrane protein assembly factor BamD [Bacteroidia bacterium]